LGSHVIIICVTVPEDLICLIVTVNFIRILLLIIIAYYYYYLFKLGFEIIMDVCAVYGVK